MKEGGGGPPKGRAGFRVGPSSSFSFFMRGRGQGRHSRSPVFTIWPFLPQKRAQSTGPRTAQVPTVLIVLLPLYTNAFMFPHPTM